MSVVTEGVDLEPIFLSAVEEALASFQPDELAYMAVTSKPEDHFGDRLAWCLTLRLKPSCLFVGREWKLFDLAVLEPPGKPLLLGELKWMYSFDVLFAEEGRNWAAH